MEDAPATLEERPADAELPDAMALVPPLAGREVPLATPEEDLPDDATPEDATPELACADEAWPEEATPDDGRPDDPTPDEATPDDVVAALVAPDVLARELDPAAVLDARLVPPLETPGPDVDAPEEATPDDDGGGPLLPPPATVVVRETWLLVWSGSDAPLLIAEAPALMTVPPATLLLTLANRVNVARSLGNAVKLHVTLAGPGWPTGGTLGHCTEVVAKETNVVPAGTAKFMYTKPTASGPDRVNVKV